jgi:hypothetical protein
MELKTAEFKSVVKSPTPVCTLVVAWDKPAPGSRLTGPRHAPVFQPHYTRGMRDRDGRYVAAEYPRSSSPIAVLSHKPELHDSKGRALSKSSFGRTIPHICVTV